jgi:hypothetical protein
MGTSHSKSVIENVTEIITNIAVSTVQDCEVSSYQTQTMNVRNTGFTFWDSYKVVQSTEITNECFSNTEKEIDLQNKIINEIKQRITNKGISLLDAFGKPKQEAEVNLSNLIKTAIKFDNINKTYTRILQEQRTDFSNSGILIFRTAEVIQGSKIFASAVIHELNRVGVFNTIENHIDQELQKKSTGIFDNLTDNLTMVVIVIIAAIGVLFTLMVIFGS